MLRKNWSALGSFLKEDRPRALDLLGFRSQLVFNTFLSAVPVRPSSTSRTSTSPTASPRAHNRAMVDFCSVDRRLLAVGYVPLADFERARAMAEDAIALGCKALLVPSACPSTHSPSHVGLFPVWALAQEAGLPIVFHVGGGGRLLAPRYFDNGLPPVPDFHGGAENFRSVDYMAIPYPPMQTLATMIIDGVLDRFPRLKVGVIEQGAVWAAELDAPARRGAGGVREERGAAARARSSGRASTSAARSASRPTPPSRWAGSSSRPGRRSACSRRTGRTSRAAGTR